MKPYLVSFLRDRDLRGFQTILQGITAPQPGDCRRVVLRCFEVLLPAVRHRFPLLTESEMWDMALARVAELDIPADLDELRAREDSTFELCLPESEPQGPPPPDLADVLDGRPKSNPAAVPLLRQYTQKREPRP